MDELLDEMADPMPSGIEMVVLSRGSSTLGPLSKSREADLLGSPVSDGAMIALLFPLSVVGGVVFLSGRMRPTLKARAVSLKLLVLDLLPSSGLEENLVVPFSSGETTELRLLSKEWRTDFGRLIR